MKGGFRGEIRCDFRLVSYSGGRGGVLRKAGVKQNPLFDFRFIRYLSSPAIVVPTRMLVVMEG